MAGSDHMSLGSGTQFHFAGGSSTYQKASFWTPIGFPIIQFNSDIIYWKIASNSTVKGSVPQDSPHPRIPLPKYSVLILYAYVLWSDYHSMVS